MIKDVETKFKSVNEERIYLKAVLREVKELGLYIQEHQVIDRFLRLTGGSHIEQEAIDDGETDELEIIEILSACEHESWARWQAYLHENLMERPDGSLMILKEQVDRWNRQIRTPYSALTRDEQESDRKEVRRAISRLKAEGFIIIRG